MDKYTSLSLTFSLYLFIFATLWIEPRALDMLAKHITIKIHPQIFVILSLLAGWLSPQ
jgi:hypothetical protein